MQTQGSRNIIVNIPKGTNSEEARQQVGTTAKLYFRPVLATEASTGAATASPSPSASGSASSEPVELGQLQGDRFLDRLRDPDGHRHLSGPRRQRRAEGRRHLVREPQRLGLGQRHPVGEQQRRRHRGGRQAGGPVHRARLLQEVGPERRQGRQGRGRRPWPAARSRRRLVQVRARPRRGRRHRRQEGRGRLRTRRPPPAGRSPWTSPARAANKFAKVTGELAKNTAPQNEFGIVLDGQVVSSPSVSSSITGGSARDLRQLHPGRGPEPRQHAVVRRPAADLQERTASPR